MHVELRLHICIVTTMYFATSRLFERVLLNYKIKWKPEQSLQIRPVICHYPISSQTPIQIPFSCLKLIKNWPISSLSWFHWRYIILLSLFDSRLSPDYIDISRDSVDQNITKIIKKREDIRINGKTICVSSNDDSPLQIRNYP